eukprot:jgi/Botrbrau1/707/Bobra.160_2s0030.1
MDVHKNRTSTLTPQQNVWGAVRAKTTIFSQLEEVRRRTRQSDGEVDAQDQVLKMLHEVEQERDELRAKLLEAEAFCKGVGDYEVLVRSQMEAYENERTQEKRRFEAVAEADRARIQELRTRIDNLQGQCDLLRSNCEQHTVKLKEWEDYDDKVAKLQRLQNQFRDMQGECEKLRSKNTKLELAIGEAHTARLAAQTEALTAAEELRQASTARERAEAVATEAIAAREAADATVIRLQAAVAQLQEELQVALEEASSREEQLQGAQSTMLAQQAQLQESHLQAATIRELRDMLASSGAEQSSLKRQLEEQEGRALSLQAELAGSLGEVARLREELQAAQAQITALSSQHAKDAASLQNGIEKAESDLNSFRIQKEKSDKELKSANGAIKSLRANLEESEEGRVRLQQALEEAQQEARAARAAEAAARAAQAAAMDASEKASKAAKASEAALAARQAVASSTVSPSLLAALAVPMPAPSPVLVAEEYEDAFEEAQEGPSGDEDDEVDLLKGAHILGSPSRPPPASARTSSVAHSEGVANQGITSPFRGTPSILKPVAMFTRIFNRRGTASDVTAGVSDATDNAASAAPKAPASIERFSSPAPEPLVEEPRQPEAPPPAPSLLVPESKSKPQDGAQTPPAEVEASGVSVTARPSALAALAAGPQPAPAASDVTDAKAAAAWRPPSRNGHAAVEPKPGEGIPSASADSSLLPAAARPRRTRKGGKAADSAPEPVSSAGDPADSADSRPQRAPSRRQTRGRVAGGAVPVEPLPEKSAPLTGGGAAAPADSADSGQRSASRRQTRSKARSVDQPLASVPEETPAAGGEGRSPAPEDSADSKLRPPARGRGLRRRTDPVLDAVPEETGLIVPPGGSASIPQNPGGDAISEGHADAPERHSGPNDVLLAEATLVEIAVEAESAEPTRPKRKPPLRAAKAPAAADASLGPAVGPPQAAGQGAASKLPGAEGPPPLPPGEAPDGEDGGGALDGDRPGRHSFPQVSGILSTLQGVLAVVLPDGPPRDGDQLLEVPEAAVAAAGDIPEEHPEAPSQGPDAALVAPRQNPRKGAKPSRFSASGVGTRDSQPAPGARAKKGPAPGGTATKASGPTTLAPGAEAVAGGRVLVAGQQEATVTREYTEVDLVVTEVAVPRARAVEGGTLRGRKESGNAEGARRGGPRSGRSLARGPAAASGPASLLRARGGGTATAAAPRDRDAENVPANASQEAKPSGAAKKREGPEEAASHEEPPLKRRLTSMLLDYLPWSPRSPAAPSRGPVDAAEASQELNSTTQGPEDALRGPQVGQQGTQGLPQLAGSLRDAQEALPLGQEPDAKKAAFRSKKPARGSAAGAAKTRGKERSAAGPRTGGASEDP